AGAASNQITCLPVPKRNYTTATKRPRRTTWKPSAMKVETFTASDEKRQHL
ncbi:unnamed protein product, partial [Ceratitis capitata]